MGGFTTHVAGRRHVLKGKLPPPVSMDDIHAYFKREKKLMALLDKADFVNIGLPCDGESFNDETASECAERLESLRDMGYHVPQYAIDALREEAE
jgi:hypothetical protein